MKPIAQNNSLELTKNEATESAGGPADISSQSRQELILENRQLAFRMVKSMLRRISVDLWPEEVQSIADMALCEAALRYQSVPGATFNTYSFYFLKAEIRKSLRLQMSARIESACNGVEESEGDDNFESTIESQVSAGTDSCPEHRAAMGEVRKFGFTKFGNLNKVERAIFVGTFVHEKTMSDMAKELGYSRGHLFAVRKSAEEKLRKVMCKTNLDLAA